MATTVGRVKASLCEGLQALLSAFVSSMVSLNRKLPDVRSDECKQKVYTNLPKCSILIPFHDDDWMVT
jgi:hypothetical protein